MMKFQLFLLLTIFFLESFAQAVPENGNSQELIDKGLKHLAIEKGSITYKIEGQPNDTLMLFFDRFGWREVSLEYGEKKFYGMKTNISTKAIMDGASFYTINLMDSSGKFRTDLDLVKLAGYKTPEEIFIAKMSKIKATLTGSQTFLDKECEVWQYVSRSKTCELWAWKGLVLMHQNASQKKIAIALNFDVIIADQVFSIPEGIDWKNPSK